MKFANFCKIYVNFIKLSNLKWCISDVPIDITVYSTSCKKNKINIYVIPICYDETHVCLYNNNVYLGEINMLGGNSASHFKRARSMGMLRVAEHLTKGK